jgi:hypothetical protein
MKSNHSSDAPIRPASPFMGIDAQSGRFRLAITITFFLFCWSLLAILDYYFNPLPNIPSLAEFWLGKASVAGFSRSLLDHYFSMFSMFNMAILSTLWLLGFQSAKAIITDALQLSNPRFAGRYLRKRAFFNQTPSEVDTTVEGFQASDAGKIISQLGGPCLIKLNPDYGALIENRKNEYRFLLAAAGGDHAWISHQEKLIGILPVHQSEFKLCFAAICADGTRLSIKDMRITAANPMAEIVSGLEDSQTAEIPITNLDDFNRYILANWYGFTKESLQSEVKSFFLKSNRIVIARYFSIEIGNSSKIHQKKQRYHSKNHHLDHYPMTGFIFHGNRLGSFSRNRRRSLLPELRSTLTVVKESDSQSAYFSDELQKYLTQNCKRIYNNAIINPRIISSGEITVE